MRSFLARHPGWTVLIVFLVLFLAFLIEQSWMGLSEG
jgi:hypothetical protein